MNSGAVSPVSRNLREQISGSDWFAEREVARGVLLVPRLPSSHDTDS